MFFGVVGDTHGFIEDAVNVINEMGKRKITHVFVVGDFGLWTHFADGQEFLDEVNAAAYANKLSVFAVGGNHENWDHWEWFVNNLPTHKGFAMVRRRVLLAPKIHQFTLANRRFVVAGGAVSIDKEDRIRKERGYEDSWTNRHVWGSGERTLYWPNEELTDDQVRYIELRYPKADILLTHDCSNFTAFEGRLKPDPDSERHRKRIDRVIRATKPDMHFHGHMHTKYDWDNTLSHGDSAFLEEPWTGPVTKTYGLECNPGAFHTRRPTDWWGICDSDTLSFKWQSELVD